MFLIPERWNTPDVFTKAFESLELHNSLFVSCLVIKNLYHSSKAAVCGLTLVQQWSLFLLGSTLSLSLNARRVISMMGHLSESKDSKPNIT